MRLLVVIPHHSQRASLDRALAAVAGLPTMIVDDSPRGMERPVADRLRTRGEEGFARAANRGLAEAERRGFSHVLLLNDDAVPEPGCVDALCAAFVEGVGAVGPVLVEPDGDKAGFVVRRWGRVRERRLDEAAAPIDALSGAALLVPAWARFDPAFLHGMEDLALCQNLRRAGLRLVLVPEARCRHEGGASLSRRSPAALRAAMQGQLLLHGRSRAPVVALLGLGQVLREGGGLEHLRALGQGLARGLR
jgi:GT2 family glycosyltransferase